MSVYDSMTPEQRSLRARVAALSRSAHSDPREMTAAASAGFLKRFELQVDPNNELSEEERTRRATAARRAYMCGLRLKRSRKDAT